MGITMTVKDTYAVTLEELLLNFPFSKANKEVKEMKEEIEKLKSVLREVSGCLQNNKPRLCDGCLISIGTVLNKP